MSDDMAFVYGIRAKDSSEYFYVGSTKTTIKRRFKQHLMDVRRGNHCNPHFSNKAKKLGIENVTIDVLEECAEHLRFERELWWIEHLTSQGVKLTNLVHNGMTYAFAKATRSKYSLSANWEWAKTWYADYQRGLILLPENDRFKDMSLLAQQRLADIVGRILSHPEGEHRRLIEQFE